MLERVWRKKGFIVLLIGSLTGGGIFLAMGPISPPLPRPPAPSPSQGADAAFQGVHLIETKGGRKLWEVRAEQMEVFEGKGLVKARGLQKPLQVTFYAEDGIVVARGGEALLDMQTKDVTLRGGVRAVSDKGVSLVTESLSWSAEEKRLFTDQEVILSKGGLVSRARGLEAEGTLERVKLLGRVESQVEVSQRSKRAQGRARR